MKNENLKIDVIICSKNRTEKLRRLLERVKKFSFLNNIIVISGDEKTFNLAREYTDKVFDDEGKGLGYAGKLAIEKATTNIVLIMDDDISLPENEEWFPKLIRLFKDEKVAVVTTRLRYTDGKEIFFEASFSNLAFALLRRDIVLTIGNFNPQIRGHGVDRDLYSRILTNKYKIAVDFNLIILHPINKEEWEEHWKIWKQAEKEYSLQQVYETKIEKEDDIVKFSSRDE